MRILLVEDSDVVRMLTVEVLEELDYRVIEAGEAQQALQIAGLQCHLGAQTVITGVGLEPRCQVGRVNIRRSRL